MRHHIHMEDHIFSPWLHTTDGLHAALSEQAFEQLLAEPETSIEEKAEALLQAALETGGKDNITLVLAQL